MTVPGGRRSKGNDGSLPVCYGELGFWIGWGWQGVFFLFMRILFWECFGRVYNEKLLLYDNIIVLFYNWRYCQLVLIKILRQYAEGRDEAIC